MAGRPCASRISSCPQLTRPTTYATCLSLGAEGLTALSFLPREYFQLLAWSAFPMSLTTTVGPHLRPPPLYNLSMSSAAHHHHHQSHNDVEEIHSVRSGGVFWAAGHDSSHGSIGFSAIQIRQLSGQFGVPSSACALGSAKLHANHSGDGPDRTGIAAGSSNDKLRVAQGAPHVGARGQPSRHQQVQSQTQTQRTDVVSSHNAFITGMTCALSQRLVSGVPYPPGLSGPPEAQRIKGGRWKQGERFRCVPRYLTCSTPPRRLSELLTIGNLTTQILMLCMLQIRDGAHWTPAMPPNMGPSGTFSWMAQSHPSSNGHSTKSSGRFA